MRGYDVPGLPQPPPRVPPPRPAPKGRGRRGSGSGSGSGSGGGGSSDAPKRPRRRRKGRKSGSAPKKYRPRKPKVSQRLGRSRPFAMFGTIKRLVTKLKRYLKRQGAGRTSIRNHGFTGVGNNGQTGRAGRRR